MESKRETKGEVDGVAIENATPREAVLYLIKALNTEDFQKAKEFVADDFSFTGVLGSREGADAYFNDMEKMKLKYDIKNVFAEKNDVCIIYDLAIDGKTVFGCGLYHVEEGKVTSLRVVFDPRPLLK